MATAATFGFESSCEKDVQGEARFMAVAGKDKKTFFSLQAAADLIVPIIAAVDVKAFDTIKFKVRRSSDRTAPLPALDVQIIFLNVRQCMLRARFKADVYLECSTSAAS